DVVPQPHCDPVAQSPGAIPRAIPWCNPLAAKVRHKIAELVSRMLGHAAMRTTLSWGMQTGATSRNGPLQVRNRGRSRIFGHLPSSTPAKRSGHVETAIGTHDLDRDKTGAIRGKEDDDVGNV